MTTVKTIRPRRSRYHRVVSVRLRTRLRIDDRYSTDGLIVEPHVMRRGTVYRQDVLTVLDDRRVAHADRCRQDRARAKPEIDAAEKAVGDAEKLLSENDSPDNHAAVAAAEKQLDALVTKLPMVPSPRPAAQPWTAPRVSTAVGRSFDVLRTCTSPSRAARYVVRADQARAVAT